VVDGVIDVVVVVNEVDEVMLVDDVEVVVGAGVVDDVDEVDEEVEAPTSVTLMTFDGPLSNGAPGLAAWLSATMVTVSVSVCPAAGSATENVSAQGVAAQTTDAGWLPTWVQIWDAETKLSCVQMVASPRQSKTRYVSTAGSDEGSKLALREAARAALVPSAAPMSRPTSVRGQPAIQSSKSARRDRPSRIVAEERSISSLSRGPRWHLSQSE
jgi:ABC-type sulfate/molybdate transport systems ATPase subunit